ncbi:MAG TPA: hypothetical protein VHC91_05720 [Trinickia sp.]|uniref:hypothetical protein n=1 Tax=Trinickia sp. TaxID=2571163 RepID=UPI002D029B04|nr:hypothetical protein [Trinickia sp.]HVW49890.1 hypothetical protein [Trinickia sp.]
MADNKQVSAQIDELLKKVSTGKATAIEKIKLSELLSQSAVVDAEAETQEAAKKVVEFIKENGWDVSKVVEAISETLTNPVYFNVPYQNAKGHDGIYKWWPGKKAVGKSSTYYQKLKKANREQKLIWATELGKDWLNTEEGQRWAVGAD